MPLFGFRGLAGLQEGDWGGVARPDHFTLHCSHPANTQKKDTWMSRESIRVSHSHIQIRIKKQIHNVSGMCISDASCVCRNVSISSRYDRWADSGRGHLCLQSVVWVNCCKIWQACLMIHFFSYISALFHLLWATYLEPVIRQHALELHFSSNISNIL